LRVVIGEDQALMRMGLSLVLERAGFEIVAIAADAEDVVRKTAAHRPDLLVTDIRMPPTNTDDGLRAAIESRSRVPGLPVLVLSQYLQRDYAVELLESGDEGVGYLLKQRVADVDRFVADLHRVVDGGSVLDPEVVAAMVGRHRAEADPVARLTDRQREVLELMAQGRSNAAIAAELGISEKAIVRHTSNIYEELGLGLSPDDHRRVLAVVRFLSA
jgi:DNA-binding NarL/FixJ family response regulator